MMNRFWETDYYTWCSLYIYIYIYIYICSICACGYTYTLRIIVMNFSSLPFPKFPQQSLDKYQQKKINISHHITTFWLTLSFVSPTQTGPTVSLWMRDRGNLETSDHDKTWRTTKIQELRAAGCGLGFFHFSLGWEFLGMCRYPNIHNERISFINRWLRVGAVGIS